MPRRSRNRGSGSHAPQSLLILHLDANKLRGDGLHLEKVAEFSGVLSSAAFGAPGAEARFAVGSDHGLSVAGGGPGRPGEEGGGELGEGGVGVAEERLAAGRIEGGGQLGMGGELI